MTVDPTGDARGGTSPDGTNKPPSLKDPISMQAPLQKRLAQGAPGRAEARTDEAPEVDRDFTDHRAKGDYSSHYSGLAWLQIAIEGVYLLVMAVVAGGHMLGLVMDADFISHETRWLAPASTLPAPQGGNGVRLWMTVFFAGVLGATTFSYKWLYHTVAWKEWHRDRLVWRFVVPLQGGILAVGTGCMILAGIIPLLSKETFGRLATAAGYGFLVGLFADNFLAALQKFAKRLLGTLGRDS